MFNAFMATVRTETEYFSKVPLIRALILLDRTIGIFTREKSNKREGSKDGKIKIKRIVFVDVRENKFNILCGLLKE